MLHKFNHDKNKTPLYRQLPIFLSTPFTGSPFLPRWKTRSSALSLLTLRHAAITSLTGLREHQAGTPDPAWPAPSRSGGWGPGYGQGLRVRIRGPGVGVAGKGQSQREKAVPRGEG